MPMMPIRAGLVLLAVMLMLPSGAFAIDPRFELDFRTMEEPVKLQPKQRAAREEPQSVDKAKAAPRKKASRPVEKKRKVAAQKQEEGNTLADKGYSLRLLDGAKADDEGGMETLNRVWEKLVPGKVQTRGTVDVRTGKFVLSLDPERYPVIPAADGGKILIDRNRSLPALIRNLVTENEHNVRVVSENSADRRRFVSSVLAAANFFSVEEESTLDFGTDPKLVVRANYRIEKNSDSLLNRDMVLLNVDRYRSGMPPSLLRFLKKEGFQVIESVPYRFDVSGGTRQLHHVTAREPEAIADSLMSALSLRFDRDRTLDVLGFKEQGVNLKITADRYFEDHGERFVVSLFDGDPVSYTLVRLMETGGYKVIILDPKDDLRSVAEKFIARLHLNGHYGTHALWPARDLPYNLELSGVMIHDGTRQKSVVMTTSNLEPLARELAELNGYTFSNN